MTSGLKVCRRFLSLLRYSTETLTSGPSLRKLAAIFNLKGYPTANLRPTETQMPQPKFVTSSATKESELPDHPPSRQNKDVKVAEASSSAHRGPSSLPSYYSLNKGVNHAKDLLPFKLPPPPECDSDDEDVASLPSSSSEMSTHLCDRLHSTCEGSTLPKLMPASPIFKMPPPPPESPTLNMPSPPSETHILTTSSLPTGSPLTTIPSPPSEQTVLVIPPPPASDGSSRMDMSDDDSVSLMSYMVENTSVGKGSTQTTMNNSSLGDYVILSLSVTH